MHILLLEAEGAEQSRHVLAAIRDGIGHQPVALRIMFHLVESFLMHPVEFGLTPLVAVVEDNLVARIATTGEDPRGGEKDGDGAVAFERNVVVVELAEVEARFDGDVIDDHEVIVGDGPLAIPGVHDGQFLVERGCDELPHPSDALYNGSVGPDGLLGDEGGGHLTSQSAEGGIHTT